MKVKRGLSRGRDQFDDFTCGMAEIRSMSAPTTCWRSFGPGCTQGTELDPIDTPVVLPLESDLLDHVLVCKARRPADLDDLLNTFLKTVGCVAMRSSFRVL